MINFNKIIKKFNKDELIGLWHKEDDASGLLNIWGWSLEFKANGTGTSNYWDSFANEEDFEENDEQIFLWERINSSTIKIRFIAKPEDWTVVNYKIVIQKGVYGATYKKLFESINKESFWIYPEPLFKKHPSVFLTKKDIKR